ncbi:SDR family NAD(P)-dependent oxidoreductase [Streptomyces sp. NPDC002838]|uniref:SDR family NAD(P)-dependent oxidoreductase n=1 Tax=Streptomyces sp. NPDC002838 TaxID=3154436 RepID=UPI003323143D
MSRTLALVTGASSGIGAAYARLLAPDHDLILVARRGDRLHDLAGRLRAAGAGVEVLVADLSSHDGLAAVTGRLATGDVRLLISNAGAGGYAPLTDVAPDEVDRLLTLNAVAPIQLVAGLVDQHHPLPLTAGIAPLGLIGHRRDHLIGVAFDRGGQPIRLRRGPLGGCGPVGIAAPDHIAGLTRRRARGRRPRRRSPFASARSSPRRPGGEKNGPPPAAAFLAAALLVSSRSASGRITIPSMCPSPLCVHSLTPDLDGPAAEVSLTVMKVSSAAFQADTVALYLWLTETAPRPRSGRVSGRGGLPGRPRGHR